MKLSLLCSATLLLTLAACTSDKGLDTGTPTDTDTDTDTDPDTDTDIPEDTDTSSLCGEPFAFSDPGATEYLQWAINGVEYNGVVPLVGGEYFPDKFISVVAKTADQLNVLGFGSSGPFPSGAPAGLYRCAGAGSLFVNAETAGRASDVVANSACIIVLEEPVSNGGHLSGYLSADLADLAGTPTVCVEARFSLTDLK